MAFVSVFGTFGIPYSCTCTCIIIYYVYVHVHVHVHYTCSIIRYMHVCYNSTCIIDSTCSKFYDSLISLPWPI